MEGGKSKRRMTSKDSLFHHHHYPNFYDFFPREIAPFTGNISLCKENLFHFFIFYSFHVTVDNVKLAELIWNGKKRRNNHLSSKLMVLLFLSKTPALSCYADFCLTVLKVRNLAILWPVLTICRPPSHRKINLATSHIPSHFQI